MRCGSMLRLRAPPPGAVGRSKLTCELVPPSPQVPIPFFGGLLQFMFFALFLGIIFNVLKGFLSASQGSKSKRDDWDNL